ncbi:MAG: Fe2+ transport system protein [Massilibacillus sp.]|nr:Fe2+ transport system protein [Massilibacillus sp.]
MSMIGGTEMTLNDVKPGTTVRIEGLENSNIKSRLMSMGLIKGTSVKVLRSAPMGDPMAISVRSYNLAVRVADAKKITVSAI